MEKSSLIDTLIRFNDYSVVAYMLGHHVGQPTEWWMGVVSTEITDLQTRELQVSRGIGQAKAATLCWKNIDIYSRKIHF